MRTAVKQYLCAGLLVLLALPGCSGSKPKGEASGPGLDPETTGLRVSGPHVHENLAVFLLHADSQDGRDFLTLEEGLERGLVRISEMDQERVSELQLVNQSDYPLYLQEGERLYGGKQDRT